MENQIQDTNTATVEPKKEYVSDTNAIREKLEAEIKAKREADTARRNPPPATVPAVPAATVATEPSKAQVGPPPAAKAAEPTKPDPVQQFRDKDGQVSLQKVEQANEHLQKAIDDAEARLQAAIKLNKELRQKHRKVTTEAKSEEKTLDAKLPEVTANMTPEIKAKFAEMLEKDPVGAIFEITRLGARSEIDPFRRDFEGFREENKDTSLARELDDIGQNGNPWVFTEEGQRLFDAVFQERPWLFQSRTPYKDALRFINAPAAPATAAAPAVKSTPILGGGSAVPPPSSAPTETPMDQLKRLKSEFNLALARRDMKLAGELGEKIKQLDQTRYPIR